MNANIFRAFVKEALSIQTTDADTPEDYVAVRAAVSAKFPGLEKASMTMSFVQRAAQNTLASNPNRVGSFITRMRNIGTPKATAAKDVAVSAARSHLSGTRQFSGARTGNNLPPVAGEFLAKNASSPLWHSAAEIGGLGMLAKPSIDELRGKHVDEKKKAKTEIAGLGVLAAPAAHEMGSGIMAKFRKAAPVASHL